MMDFAAFCASHSPICLVEPEADPAFGGVLHGAAEWIHSFKPDLVIQFGPDHFSGFFYDMMPNFCIGVAAESVGDWGTPPGPLDVPKQTALALLAAVRAADIDIDLSHRLPVDHGTTQIWSMMTGSLPPFPTIPIVINCAAPPRPALRRARALGEAVGAFAAGLGKRVLFAASGGLSHDPPIPQLETAEGPVREMLMAGRNAPSEARAQRETRVIAAARAFAEGHSRALAPDPAWDRRVLDLFAAGDLAAFDSWSEDEMTREGGCGGHEIRTWIAALAALKAASGRYQLRVDHYAVTPAWMTGMGVASAFGLGPDAYEGVK